MKLKTNKTFTKGTRKKNRNKKISTKIEKNIYNKLELKD
jgi:hypothetical protein